MASTSAHREIRAPASSVLLSLAAVQQQYLPVSRSTIARYVRAGRFPIPIKMSASRASPIFFRKSEIEAWLARKVDEAPGRP